MEMPARAIYNMPFTRRFVEISIFENGFNEEDSPVTFEYIAAEDFDGKEFDKTLVAIHPGHQQPRRFQRSPLKD